MAFSATLVGRASELDSLERAIARLDDGEPAAVEVVGEPGIGKTRLLAELAERADRRGHTVLSGSASELERDLPFSVFVNALDEFLQALDPRRLDALDDGVKAELATVFPSFPVTVSDRAVAIQAERYRSHRAVRRLFELLARRKPVVLVLDDVHWADSASVELLGALLQKPPVAPVLLVLATRPRQTSERLSVALERALRIRTLERLELGALSPEEARELVGVIVAGTDSGALYEDTGGNPFYLEQLARSAARSAVSGRAAHGASLHGVDIPPVVAAALGEELGLLSERARAVLEGASVAGDPFDTELAAAAAGVGDDDALDALDELLRLDLVRPTDVPRRFRFRHPLVRRAVYELTPGGRRLGAHERCATALARLGAPPSARAHHVEFAARVGDADAVALLREAGEGAAGRAPASAAQWFGSALRILSESAPPTQRIELLVARAGALAATGQFVEGHAALLEALEIVPRDDEDLLVRVTTACATVEHLLGRQKTARAHLEAALAALRDRQSAQAVELMIELSLDGLYSGDFGDMSAQASRAASVAALLEDRPLLASALAARALGAALAGMGDGARAQATEAAALVDALSDDELAPRLDALAYLSCAEVYLDRFEAGGDHAKRALDIGRATGQGGQFPLIEPMYGTSLWVRGRPAESAEVFDGAIEGSRLVGNVQGLSWNLFNRSFAALAAGDVDTALATAEESFELAQELDEGTVTAHSASALAAALLESGRCERAADLFVAKVGGEELRLVGGGWRAWYLEMLTRAWLGAGRRADAERAARAAQECAEEVDLPRARGMARLAAAAIDLDAGDPAGAAAHAAAAIPFLNEVGDVYGVAHARVVAGRAFARAGDSDRALAELERAASAFDSFGSTRYLQQAELELRKLGQRTRRRPGSAADGIGRLTSRELEIARLVVERKTNPEIAAELFLSQKTVETHLRNAFRKLDVSSRVELARAVERADREQGASL
jgi:DNA-binding CsgD family transcriptional regulator